MWNSLPIILNRASPSMTSPQGCKTCLLGRDFHTLIRNVSFPSSTDVGSHNPPHHAWGRSVLASIRPVSGSDTICNSPSPLIEDIVLFRLSLQGRCVNGDSEPPKRVDCKIPHQLERGTKHSLRVWKPLPNIRVIKLWGESLKRTISPSGGLVLLQTLSLQHE